MHSIWHVWAKALGTKEGHDRQADAVAIVRTVIVLTNFITCFFIIAGVIRHWN